MPVPALARLRMAWRGYITTDMRCTLAQSPGSLAGHGQSCLVHDGILTISQRGGSRNSSGEGEPDIHSTETFLFRRTKAWAIERERRSCPRPTESWL